MRYLTVMSIMLCSHFIFAQKQKLLEPAILEVQYKFEMQHDTITRNLNKEDLMILRIGNTMSQFFSSSRFYGDSLVNDPEGRKLWGQLMVQAVRQRNFDSMPVGKTTGDYIYKNYPEGKVTVTDQMMVDYFIYEEDYEPQAWQISDSVKQVLDYWCQQAECSFRGRHWTVWFTPDIPISDGPWKLNGLPSLILEAYDTHKDYHYTAVGIQQNDLPLVTFYNFGEKKLIKTDRVSFLQAASKLMNSNDPNREIEAATGIDLSGGKAAAPREKKNHYEFIAILRYKSV